MPRLIVHKRTCAHTQGTDGYGRDFIGCFTLDAWVSQIQGELG